MRVFESVFGPGAVVESFDSKQLDQLKSEFVDYAKKSIDDVFVIELKVDADGDAEVEDFAIADVQGLVQILAEGEGMTFDPKKLQDSDVQHIFASLKGFAADVRNSRQAVTNKAGHVDKERIGFHFKVNNWHYDKSADRIEIDADISNVRL